MKSSKSPNPKSLKRTIKLAGAQIVAMVATAATAILQGAENIPQKPFAQAVFLPTPGQFIVTPWYQYSEYFHVWRGANKESIERNAGGDGHGFDLNDGIMSVEYGITKDWAADATLGYTSAASRSFNTVGYVDATKGIMDTTFGLRYQAMRESDSSCPFAPTVTFRAGGIYRGNYDPNYPFAPGNGSVGIEPSVLLNKHLGWDGFGLYGHTGFRWMRSGGNDQWFGSIGAFQEIKRFTINAGFRHFANTSGRDIGGTGASFPYSRFIKEVKEEIQGGVGYTTEKHAFHYQFYMGKVVDGRNTGSALTFGLYADFPIGGK